MKAPIETEIKLHVGSVAKARALLRRHGFAVTTQRVFERNLVLDDDSGSLRKSGMLLRVRGAGKPGGLKKVTCTFKGSEAPGRHKRREEREFRADDLESCVAVFAELGFRETFQYEKYRTEFGRDHEPGHVTVDETPIGVFMELEGPPGWIDRTAKMLGFPRTAYVTSSYVRLYEDWCRGNGVEVGNMRFPRRGK